VLLASAGKPFISLPEQPRIAYASQSYSGAVPVPPGRPYSLGEPVTPSFTDVTAVGRSRRQVAERAPEEAPRRTVSARSPMRYDSQAGVISGRGLY
jgi:hypothetical protein